MKKISFIVLLCFSSFSFAGESVKPNLNSEPSSTTTDLDEKIICENPLILPMTQEKVAETLPTTGAKEKEAASHPISQEVSKKETLPETEIQNSEQSQPQKTTASVWKKRAIIAGIGLGVAAGGTYIVERILQTIEEKDLRDKNGPTMPTQPQSNSTSK